jgi:hypothetical protein
MKIVYYQIDLILLIRQWKNPSKVRLMKKKMFLEWGSNPQKSWKYRDLACQYKIRAQDLNFQEDQI